MQKNSYPTETLIVTIDYLDTLGHGIAYHRFTRDDGKLGKQLKLIIPHTLPGEQVSVTVPNAKGRKRAHVHYNRVLVPSPDRIGGLEGNDQIAGGMALQFMHYEAQLAYKEAMVKHEFTKHAFDPSCVRSIIGMTNPYHYRNKMELTFGQDGAIGMHAPNNFRKIIDWQSSLIAPELMVAIKQTVQAWQIKHQLPSYDKDSGEGLLRHLMMRLSHSTGEVMVALYATSYDDTLQGAIAELKAKLVTQFPEIKSLLWLVNTDKADRTQAEDTIVLHGRDYIHDELCGFDYQLWPDTFFQPNPTQAKVMVEQALDMSDVNKDARVLDLFCGVGTFSLPFAKRAKALAGIEIVESSIQCAKYNARHNHIENTYFIARDARKGMIEIAEHWGHPDLLLLDPPRSGAGGKVMRRIGRLGCQRVVYVSCNPITLAEDLVWLRDFGYELKIVQPIDQFPHTQHVECVVLMEKVDV